ncbi:uncharacterized protein LOC129744380 [Uranotaenia lowii]|uniref:uncharacterized protein LOC129744380 n=1 Tax=Uranotaenia lowii TaxID=190385 RepID=UPI00247A9AAA|nr:uncharacterized protein LOC129744380 [Uranotaenia lowii]
MDQPFHHTSEDPLIRKRFSESILDILRPMTEAELPLLSRADAISDYSTLSDPFSDLDESYILLDQREKKAGDDEGDEMLLNQFTPEFKMIYEEMVASKKEEQTQEEVPPCEPEPVDSSETKPTEGKRHSAGDAEAMLLREPGEFSPQFKCFLEDMLQKCELKYHQEEKKKRDALKKKERRVRRAASDESLGATGPPEHDSLSGVWRMLDAVSVDNGFPISNNFYNLYDDRRFAWLTRDEVPWDQMEASRRKCEQWLKMTPSRPESKH